MRIKGNGEIVMTLFELYQGIASLREQGIAGDTPCVVDIVDATDAEYTRGDVLTIGCYNTSEGHRIIIELSNIR